MFGASDVKQSALRFDPSERKGERAEREGEGEIAVEMIMSGGRVWAVFTPRRKLNPFPALTASRTTFRGRFRAVRDPRRRV